MHRRLRNSALATLIALIAFGCGESSTPSPADAGADHEESPPPGTATSVRFAPDDTLTLAPGEPHQLEVIVEPPGEHRVRFSLLGQSLDASLEADLRTTDPDGRTGTRLIAPHSATTFLVRAVADDGPTAEIAVSVSSSGFGSILVVPEYAGKRTTETWVVTAAALSTCAEKEGIPPSDGPLWAQGDAPPIALDDVPAGTPLAITARSGNAVGGCADVAKLASGTKQTVKVTISDRPIRLENTDATLSMTLAPDGAALLPWLEKASSSFVTAFNGDKPDETALLDEMVLQMPYPDEFAEARKSGGWDQKTREYLEAKGKLPSDRVRAWISKGTMPLQAGVTLEARLVGQSSSPAHPTLNALGFGGIEAPEVFPIGEYTVTLSADPGDTIHLGGSVFLLPSRFLANAAEAASTTSAGTDPIEGLQKAIACDDLATAVLSWGEPLKTCGGVCLALACNDAIESMWMRSREQSVGTFSAAGLSFTISADALVDSEADIVEFDGTWAGELSEGTEAISVKGTVQGSGVR